MLGLLLLLGDFRWRDLVAALAGLPVWLLVLTLLLVVLQVGLSTAKWRLAMRSFSAAGEPLPLTWAGSFHATALGALLSHVLPVHVSTLLARGAALALQRGRGKLVSGSATSAMEQMFDVLATAMIAVAAIALLFGGNLLALLLIAAMLIAALGVLPVASRWSMQRAGRLLKRLRQRRPRLDGIVEAIGTAASVDGSVLRTMLALSILRTFGILARPVALAAVLLPGLGAATALGAAGTVQGTILLAFTPGGLGLVEASWTGVLGLLSVPLSQALVFTLTLRLTHLGALLAVVGLSWAASSGKPRVPRASRVRG